MSYSDTTGDAGHQLAIAVSAFENLLQASGLFGFEGSDSSTGFFLVTFGIFFFKAVACREHRIV
jgi:hypothetical protein